MSTLGSVIGRGLHSARPAAGTAGALYYETDTSTLFRDSGSAWESVEGSGTPADIVDIPTAETDTTLVLAPDGLGGVEFRAETGGGGGSKYDPDNETPTTTPAVQAEFNSSRSPFAWGTAPPTDDITSYPGYLYSGGGNGNYWLTTAWTPGATDLTVACKLLISNQNTSTSVLSVMFGVSGATGTDPSEAVLATLFVKDGASSTIAGYNRTSGSYSNFGAENTVLFGPSTVPVWLRLVRVNAGPTWTVYFSQNGVSWTAHATTGSKSLTVGAISLRIADQIHTVGIDWIRAWSSVVERVGA